MKTKLISSEYYDEYKKKLKYDIEERMTKKIELYHNETDFKKLFSYYFSVSSVYSSQIEGNPVDLRSYMKYKKTAPHNKSKNIKEINDLITAYQYASETKLTQRAFLEAHAKLSKSFLIKNYRGHYRDQSIGVYNEDGFLIYVGIEPNKVKKEMDKLFSDISVLLRADIDISEIIYYASMIHLILAQIHPFMDGNGRISRLMEKWFIANKIGSIVWLQNTEKYYWEKRSLYYKNINIGVNYYEIDYNKCIPFLLMLPKAL